MCFPKKIPSIQKLNELLPNTCWKHVQHNVLNYKLYIVLHHLNDCPTQRMCAEVQNNTKTARCATIHAKITLEFRSNKRQQERKEEKTHVGIHYEINQWIFKRIIIFLRIYFFLFFALFLSLYPKDMLTWLFFFSFHVIRKMFIKICEWNESRVNGHQQDKWKNFQNEEKKKWNEQTKHNCVLCRWKENIKFA